MKCRAARGLRDALAHAVRSPLLYKAGKYLRSVTPPCLTSRRRLGGLQEGFSPVLPAPRELSNMLILNRFPAPFNK